jgi:hypothetical protein
LMSDVLSCPSSLGEDCEVIIGAVAINVLRHLKCRDLKGAGSQGDLSHAMFNSIFASHSARERFR